MVDNRTAILTGVKGAHELHRDLNIREQIDRDESDPDKIGGVATRRVTAQSDERRHGEVTLREQRPWMPQKPNREFHLRYDLRGPERPGMWEPDRRRLFQAA